MINNSSISKSLFYVAIILLWGILLTAVIGHHPDTNAQHSLVRSIQNLYNPHHNISPAPHIRGVNFYVYVYLVLFLSAISLRLIAKCSHPETQKVSTPVSILFQCTMILYALTINAQTFSLLRHALNEFRVYAEKSTEEKYAHIISGKAYTFARYCRSLLHGPHRADFITDMDLANDPGMITHRMLAYHLYPIDIRGIREEAADSLILFKKKNAVASVPENFEIIGRFDEDSLIAAPKNKGGQP